MSVYVFRVAKLCLSINILVLFCLRLCNWLENEGDLYSISELYEQMISLAPSNSEVYSSHQYLKKKLQEKYCEAIFFAEINGKSDVLCFRDTAGDIIRKYWDERKDNTDDSKSFVIAAAKILISELRSKTDFDVIHYPNSSDIADVESNKLWLPELLRVFMETLIKDPLKQASIGQSIAHAIKPRSSLPPIPFGLAVEMDHVFGSKWLQNELSSLGYSCSSDEVTRYKQCVVSNENINDFLKVALQGNFSQWSADNVDHRVCSIDGKGDLHGMGIVISTTGSSTTPFLENSLPEIPRQKIQKVGDVTRRRVIPISSYIQADEVGLSKIDINQYQCFIYIDL